MLRPPMLAATCLALAACGGGDESAGGNNAALAPAGIASAASGGGGAGGSGPGADAKASLLDRLSAGSDHSTLANAVNAAGLTQTLSGAQPYTLFAPTNAAFETLPAGTVNAMLAPDARGQLTALLTGHIVPGVVTADDLRAAIARGSGKAQLATVGGSTLTLARDGNAIVVTGPKGSARIAGGERQSANGVIHSLDAVLMP